MKWSTLGVRQVKDQTGWQYSDGDPPNGGVECKGYEKNHDFWPISRFISQMMQDRAIVTMEGEDVAVRWRHRSWPSSLSRFTSLRLQLGLPFNPLESRCNYSATSNNIKLVHWPLIGGLLHLVQRGGVWRMAQRLGVWPQLSLYCCIIVRCCAILMWVLKG